MAEQVRISQEANHALYNAITQLIGENGAIRSDALDKRLPLSTENAVEIFTENPAHEASLEQVAAIVDGLCGSEHGYFKELQQLLEQHGISTKEFAPEYHHYYESIEQAKREIHEARAAEEAEEVAEPLTWVARTERHETAPVEAVSVEPTQPLSDADRALAERVGFEGTSTPRDSDEVLMRATLAATEQGIESARLWGESLNKNGISPDNIAQSKGGEREIG